MMAHATCHHYTCLVFEYTFSQGPGIHRDWLGHGESISFTRSGQFFSFQYDTGTGEAWRRILGCFIEKLMEKF